MTFLYFAMLPIFQLFVEHIWKSLFLKSAIHSQEASEHSLQNLSFALSFSENIYLSLIRNSLEWFFYFLTAAWQRETGKGKIQLKSLQFTYLLQFPAVLAVFEYYFTLAIWKICFTSISQFVEWLDPNCPKMQRFLCSRECTAIRNLLNRKIAQYNPNN